MRQWLTTVCVTLSLLAASAAAATGQARTAGTATLVSDPPIACSMCETWNAPRAPFQVFANTYYVGTQGLSSLLIVTSEGLVLIDVPLPQSVALVDANIRGLGFRTTDVKYILTSHGHYDHVGGVHAMQRFTGATVVASPSTAQALALGHPVPGDPQFGTGALDRFPAVTNGVRVQQDGETLRIGGTVITARHTPGHTPGATTWTWRSCEGERCLDMVYVDSLTAVSNDGYRFTDAAGALGTFRATLQKVRALPCDVVVSTHPGATGLDERLSARERDRVAPGAAGDPFVDSTACRALAERSMKALDARVAKEAGG